MPGTAARHDPAQAAQRARRRLLGAGLLGAVRAGEHHVRLEQDRLEGHPLVAQRGEHAAQGEVGHLLAAVDRVGAVHEDLRLDDRHEPALLAEGGIPGQGVGVDIDAVAGRVLVADRDHRPPLGKAGTELSVVGDALAQTVQALGDLLPVGAGERLGPRVHLDPGHDPLAREKLRKRGAVRRALANRLVVEDGPADVRARALGGEHQLAKVATVLAGGRNVEHRVQALVHRPAALVRGQDALAVGDQRAGGFLDVDLLGVHGPFRYTATATLSYPPRAIHSPQKISVSD